MSENSEIHVSEYYIKPDFDFESMPERSLKLLLCLLKWRDNKTKRCGYSLRTMAKKLGWGVNTVREQLEWLEENKMITSQSGAQIGKKKEVNQYTITTKLYGLRFEESAAGTTFGGGDSGDGGGSSVSEPDTPNHPSVSEPDTLSVSESDTYLSPTTYKTDPVALQKLEAYEPHEMYLTAFRMKGLTDADILIALADFKLNPENAQFHQNFDRKFSNYLQIALNRMHSEHAKKAADEKIANMRVDKYQSKVEKNTKAEATFAEGLNDHYAQKSGFTKRENVNPTAFVNRAELEEYCAEKAKQGIRVVWPENWMVEARIQWGEKINPEEEQGTAVATALTQKAGLFQV